MKIGVYDPYLDTLGGGEKYILTAAECSASMHDVTVFWNDKTVIQNGERRFGLDLSRVTISDNIFTGSTSLYNKLKITQKYDVIIFLSDGSIPLSLARKTIIHFQFPIEWVNSFNPLTRFKVSRLSSVICNSQFTKKYIDKKLGVKSLLLYPPVNIEGIEKVKSKKENIILTVGNYKNMPNGKDFKKHSVLIDVFKDMLKEGLTGWKLHIVTGYFPHDKDKVAFLKKQAHGHPITFYENLKISELFKIYAKSKVYWHAAGFEEDLKKHPERAEHFGISTVEAMAAGCVPVVINAGGQAEIVQDEGNGFLWETTDELKVITQKLIANQNLISEISQKAKKTASFFSKERFCKGISEVING